MSQNTQAPVAIDGKPSTRDRVITKLLGTITCFVAAAFLCGQVKPPWQAASDAEMTCTFVALILVAVGLMLPQNKYSWIDLDHREFVTETHYAGIRLSHTRRAFHEFDCIVVRLVDHPGGEGPDTYTGSVGLKPKARGPTLWVKSFPSDEEEVPQEAYEHARGLHQLTGLPLHPSCLGEDAVWT